MDKWKERGRVPLLENSLLTLKNTKIICDKCIGKGSSCLVYQGHIPSGSDIIENTEVIIKEFYPKSDVEVMDIVRDEQTGMLKISQWTKVTSEYKRKLEQFFTGIENQKRLSRSDAMEIAVKPWVEAAWGDSYYIVSNSHKGYDLSRAPLDTLEKKLLAAIGVAETMDILHEAGFLMLDIKPENLFWTQNPSIVRIIDVDSVVDKEEINQIDKSLLSNLRYASPEIHLLNHKMGEEISDEELRFVRNAMLQVDSNLYSLGLYLHELFWGELSFDAYTNERSTGQLFSSFIELYKDTSYDSEKLRLVGRKLADIISKTVIDNRTRRRKFGYQSAEILMKDLNEIYALLTSEKYIPRKEIAKANGTFAAYHLLQKYPLFQYMVTEKGAQKRLEVVIMGTHMMRKDMLSAIISIGQMLDTQLHIYLLGKDVERFLLEYLSDDYNPALSKAIVWSKNGKLVSADINPLLVARPLAHIHLMTKEPMGVIKKLEQEGIGRYYLVLEEAKGKKKELCQMIWHSMKEHYPKEKYFIGYLDSQADEPLFFKEVDTSPISVDSFSETYNEKMFENRIYNMGLMAQAYYNGFMEADADVDMEALEKEFRKDLYGVASSERVALHSIYKIASLGIPRNKPGRFLNFYRSIQDSKCLEKLAWLEHLSWTAYMLTSGAVPVFVNEKDFTKEGFEALFNEYAYQGKNDWKDKRDTKHLRHPYLAAYYLEDGMKPAKGWLSEQNEWSEKQIAMLDPLDQLCYRVNRWYKEKVNVSAANIDTKESTSANINAKCEVHIENICHLKELNYDKLLQDAHKERDIKQSDRDMVFAAVDMIV